MIDNTSKNKKGTTTGRGRRLSACCRAVKVVGVGALDLDADDVTDVQPAAALHENGAVDLRGVALAASSGWRRGFGADLVDDDVLLRADFALESFSRNCLLMLHQAVVALLLDRFGHRRGKTVGRRARHRLVAEAADAVERSLAEPVEQQREVGFRLAGEADDEGRADGEARAGGAPLADAQRVCS